MRNIVRFAVMAITVALLAFAVIAESTSAHQTEVSQGLDFAVTATDHESGTVCDMERDGHAVYADWYNDFGTRIATASDGGDPGCDEVNFPGNSKAARVTVCEVWLGDNPGAKCSSRDNL
jgi:hypothetical protein